MIQFCRQLVFTAQAYCSWYQLSIQYCKYPYNKATTPRIKPAKPPAPAAKPCGAPPADVVELTEAGALDALPDALLEWLVDEPPVKAGFVVGVLVVEGLVTDELPPEAGALDALPDALLEWRVDEPPVKAVFVVGGGVLEGLVTDELPPEVVADPDPVLPVVKSGPVEVWIVTAPAVSAYAMHRAFPADVAIPRSMPLQAERKQGVTAVWMAALPVPHWQPWSARAQPAAWIAEERQALAQAGWPDRF